MQCLLHCVVSRNTILIPYVLQFCFIKTKLKHENVYFEVVYAISGQNDSGFLFWRFLEFTFYARGNIILKFSRNILSSVNWWIRLFLQRYFVTKILSRSCYLTALTIRSFLIVDPKDNVQKVSLF